MLKAAREIRAKIANTQAPGARCARVDAVHDPAGVLRFGSFAALPIVSGPDTRDRVGGLDMPLEAITRLLSAKNGSTLLRLHTSYDCCDRFLRC
jgi:hypothetical protein